MSGAVLSTVLFLHGVGSGVTSKCRKDRHTDTHTEELEGEEGWTLQWVNLSALETQHVPYIELNREAGLLYTA